MDLWKPTEALTLIDLGYNFYIAKFNKPENIMKSLHGGPWFVNGNFLFVRQ